ncbi:DciA family protein [Streptomyces niveus]|uniref:DciA family protein n=1 Tax=Streptomyces niveus TaxID=193462 RepID=UPI00344232C7
MTTPAHSETAAGPGTSGVDLARVALRAAMANSKNQPVKKARRVTTRRADRSPGRDPVAFASAIQQMVTERAWKTPVAGGSVLDQWARIAPDLVGKVFPERFDAGTGTLHLRPVSDAYGTQLRIHQTRIIATVNKHPGDVSLVQALRILPVGAPAHQPPPVNEPAPAPRTPQPATGRDPDALPRQRHPGYLATLAAAREHKSERRENLHVARAIAGQNEALCRNRESEAVFSEAVHQQQQAQARQRNADGHRSLEASIHAARRRKRADEAHPSGDLTSVREDRNGPQLPTAQ